MRKIRLWFLVMLLAACLPLTACMQSGANGGDTRAEGAKKPEIPSSLTLDESGIPLLRVYNLNNEANSEMDIETYVAGVLAGEMRNDWPEEALKAQAILARTFVLKFIETKDSKYEGADISTDVTEAQAYAQSLVNDRIEAAVEQTRGQVASYQGELIQAWFHAHAGGKTELPTAGLDYKENPPYTESVKSEESEDAPESVKQWTAAFTLDEIQKACADAGAQTGSVTSIEIGKKGESGRAATLVVNGKEISAPAFRIALGAEKLKSTFISEISLEGEKATFTGKGFGHGVGMSQWGAYAMAQKGKTAQQIIDHYYKNVDVVKVWN